MGGKTMIKMRKILHPTDFSEFSSHAMRYAASFAQEYAATLYVLHIVEEVHTPLYFDVPQFYLQSPDSRSWTQLMAEMEDKSRRSLEDILPQEFKSTIQTVYLIRRGDPFHEIMQCASDIQADIIVCGTHGRTGLQHALFGSVAEKLVRKAPCPVFTVRMPTQKEQTPTVESTARVQPVG
jgi:nucleotide-binding universal stress UspA family protein